jgi:cyanate permease
LGIFSNINDKHAYPDHYKWVILGLLWSIYAVFGLIFRAMAPLVTPILNDLDMTYGQMGVVLGAWPITYILVSMIGGSIIDRWGVRRAIFAGAAIISLSSMLRYFPTGFGTMFFAVALFGVGGPMISVGGPKAISTWFSGKSRATAIGIYVTGNATGGLAALVITNSYIMPLTGHSWRLTFVVYGMIGFAIALLWWMIGRDAGSPEKSDDIGFGAIFKALIKVRNIQIVLVMGFCSFAIGHGFSNWLPKILETNGMSATAAGFAASVPLVLGIPSIMFIPRWVPAHARGRFIALFAFLTAGVLVAVTLSRGPRLYCGLLVLGLISSPMLPLLLLMLMDMPAVGSEYMGAAGGMFFCVSEVGGVTGPAVMGVLVDATGNFLAGTLLLSGLSLCIAAVTYLLRAGFTEQQYGETSP